MIIKPFDIQERKKDLDELNTLLTLPYINATQKQKITQEIRNIQSGLKGEQEAAYQINFHYGNNKNWSIIHDLRIEFEGYTAQIDHLLIDRFLEIYVCESKRFTEGIAINEYGEFAAFSHGKAYGISSPIEQNNRHILLLKRLFQSDKVELPMRLGLKMQPSFHSLILIANSARILRPKNGKNIEYLDRIIKNEQLVKRINQDVDDNSPSALLQQIVSASKVVFPETLQEFAEQLAKLHKPLKINWKTKFGILETLPETPIQQHQELNTIKPPQSPSRLFCAACKKTVTQTVAQYCWNNKTRFHGKVYCYQCQKNIK